MLVKDVMTKGVVSIEPDENISRALSKMKKHMVHQLPVMSSNSLYGMLELKKIVSRDFDSTTTKVSNFATNTPIIDANASLESAVQLLLDSGSHAIPVTEAGINVGIISETDLIKVAKQFVKGLNQLAREIATPAEYLTKKDNYGHLKHLMLEKNISRVPIMDGNKIIGIVGTLEMIGVIEGKERMSSGGQDHGSKEKLRLEETKANVIMRPAVVVPGEKTVNDVIDFLKSSEDVIVQTDDGFGVITAKDIIELFASMPKEQLYVQITGMHDESIEFKVKMDTALGEFVQKMGKSVDHIEYLVIHVDKMHKQGPKEKYSIRARFKTPLGLFIAHSWGWKPVDVVQEVFKTLEREVTNKYGHARTDAKKRRFLTKHK